jgi:hypothetical protein
MTSGGALCLLFDTDALAVLTAARDAIHNGWRLTHHPLYGNYRPNQQPYRSLILEYPTPRAGNQGRGCETDILSLHLIEEAMLVYAACAPLSPQKAPASLRAACALLDCELMRLPMQQAGIWTAGMEEATQGKRPTMRLAS